MTAAPGRAGSRAAGRGMDEAGTRGPGGALQAVMFDMDGLLVDSEPLWFEAEAAIMGRMGSPWGPADQQHLIGGSLTRSSAYMQRKAASRCRRRSSPGGWCRAWPT